MTLNNLLVRTAYAKDATDLPIVLILHGWDGQTAAYGEMMDRLAQGGLFVGAVGMRGRDGADGARDASGREIYDIYDALQTIRSQYAARVSPTLAAICGWSGGGGNALAAACKFPDTWNVVIDYFGMSDYGRSATDSWFVTSGYYQGGIAASVGGAPDVVPNNYYARDATAAIQNFSGGRLEIFHDDQDSTVPVVNSTRITGGLDAAGLTNYDDRITTTTDAVRYIHTLDLEYGIPERTAESIWIPLVKSTPAWTIPASGTVTVIGYIVTKRFTIWLNQGVDAAASVVYDTAAGTYTVTPLTTGNVTVSITQGALTATQTISEATTLTVE